MGRGLAAIARSPRPGVEALLKAARIGSAPSARDVAFRIAPLINSAGRIGDPALATRLLASPDLAAARPLASELVALGRKRREMSEQVEAILRPRLAPRGPVFSFDERFHPGVISATATRLCARRNAPVYLCAPAGDVVRGSGRTPKGHDAMAPLQLLAPAPRQLGGHPQACGFTIGPEQVDQLSRVIGQYWADGPDSWSPAPLGYDFSLGACRPGSRTAGRAAAAGAFRTRIRRAALPPGGGDGRSRVWVFGRSSPARQAAELPAGRTSSGSAAASTGPSWGRVWLST